jgi:hypothetical protein
MPTVIRRRPEGWDDTVRWPKGWGWLFAAAFGCSFWGWLIWRLL